MHGFQLWLNLPAENKMCAPVYRDYQAENIPQMALANNGHIKVLAGTLSLEGREITGPIMPPATAPTVPP